MYRPYQYLMEIETLFAEDPQLKHIRTHKQKTKHKIFQKFESEVPNKNICFRCSIRTNIVSVSKWNLLVVDLLSLKQTNTNTQKQHSIHFSATKIWSLTGFQPIKEQKYSYWSRNVNSNTLHNQHKESIFWGPFLSNRH